MHIAENAMLFVLHKDQSYKIYKTYVKLDHNIGEVIRTEKHKRAVILLQFVVTKPCEDTNDKDCKFVCIYKTTSIEH